jgi:hypothetical protein
MPQHDRPAGFSWNSLTMGQKGLAISGLVLLIALFLPWESYEVPGFEFGGQEFGGVDIGSFNAFSASGGLAWLSFLGIIGFLVIEGLMMGGVLPATVPGAMISAIAAGVASLLAIISFLLSLGGVTWGAFVGLIAALALGYAAYVRWNESKSAAPPPMAPPPAAPPPTAP